MEMREPNRVAWGLVAILAVVLLGALVVLVMWKPMGADEARALQAARQAVAANETWADRATYKAYGLPEGWEVFVERYPGPFGLFRQPGGFRILMIDRRGNVVRYIRTPTGPPVWPHSGTGPSRSRGAGSALPASRATRLRGAVSR